MKDATENLAGDGQHLDASPVVTFGQILFFLEFDDCTPLQSVRYHFIAQDVLENVLKKLWYFLFL